MTVGAAIAVAREHLKSDSAHLDAEVLMAHQLGKPRSWILAHVRDGLSRDDVDAFNELIQKRQAGIPVAYLTGTREFYGGEFIVNRDVLVPRPESELLIGAVLGSLDGIEYLVDVGTGSGCVAVTCKLERPKLTVVATDTSSKALAVARRNAERLKAEVMFVETDLLPDELPDPRRTLVMANLPYVPDADYDANPDLSHEPELALRGGADGLEVIYQLFDQFSRRGWFPAVLALEIDPSQVAAIEQRTGRAVDVRKDLAGRDRVVVIRF